MRFKQFILLEGQNYLGQKIGDILTAIHELRSDAKNMGSRDLIRFSERIVNQIRRIIHSNWTREDDKQLKVLQKVGVALMKAIEEKEDLIEVISGAASALEKLSGDLGVPINKLASPDDSDENPNEDALSKTEKLATPPPKPSTVDSVGPVGSPTTPDQDSFAQPLGGNSNGELEAM